MIAVALLLVHIGATTALAGLIWVVQVVHYPLFAHVGTSTFVGYHHKHVTHITRVVAPLMLMELASGAAILWIRPEAFALEALLISHTLLIVTWASTLLIQVPLHRKLELGYDPEAHQRLVLSNWLRTVCWTLRAALLLGATAGVVQ